MATIATILCAVDFSEPSRQAAAYAQALALRLGARLVCLYVAPSVGTVDERNLSGAAASQLTDDITAGAGQVMGVFVRENFPGQQVDARIVQGDPAQVLVATAAEVRADLLIMGTHGRKGLERLVFGSVAEKVLKTAGCPVLTVRPQFLERSRP